MDAAIKSLRDEQEALEKELQDYNLYCKTIKAKIATLKQSIQSLRKSKSELLRHEKSVAEINRSNSGKRKREVASTSVMKNNEPKKAQLKALEESNPIINKGKLIKRGGGDDLPTTRFERLVCDSQTSPNKCFSREEMAAAIRRIQSWTKENKDELGFYPILKDQTTKVALFTNAKQEDIELFFKCGLISSLIIFSDFKGKLNGLPKRLSEAAMLFLSIGEADEDIILNFTSSQPVFGVKGELLVPSLHYIHMKKFHNRMFFQIKDNKNTCQFDGCFDPFQICEAIARVFQRSQGIQATSRIKVNAFQIGTEESFLLISNKNDKINEKEYEAVSKFKIPFYALEGGFLSKAPHDLKRGICQLIQQNGDHNCIHCNKSKQLLTEEDNNRANLEESSRTATTRGMRLCNKAQIM
ncbi:hypothetical protein PIB30_094636 [Stylosanthes scabra]|uniref:Uncharacterized protein n=1 Tax=Stylosanthes scabra TaxID=79078 RepID=A0ABU6WTQ9_9FABA|nr:hypothetical protein [Stylosanthes scabra]